MNHSCKCKNLSHECRRVVLTGGPGAGKTAVLELARKHFCEHIAVLPEAASVVFGGGFWRWDSLGAKKAAQRAIFHVQSELERLVLDERRFAVALCDRGTVDGLAYWPDSMESFWKELATTQEQEYGRYQAVIHLRGPTEAGGYNHQNPIRVENAGQASEIDRRIAEVWRAHPNYSVVESAEHFLLKAARAVEIIRQQLPQCCRTHEIEELQGLHS